MVRQVLIYIVPLYVGPIAVCLLAPLVATLMLDFPINLEQKYTVSVYIFICSETSIYRVFNCNFTIFSLSLN